MRHAGKRDMRLPDYAIVRGPRAGEERGSDLRTVRSVNDR